MAHYSTATASVQWKMETEILIIRPKSYASKRDAFFLQVKLI